MQDVIVEQEVARKARCRKAQPLGHIRPLRLSSTPCGGSVPWVRPSPERTAIRVWSRQCLALCRKSLRWPVVIF
jgi:hypothetical protein